MKKNVYIVTGSVLIAIGLYFFLLQHNISAGGVSGMSLVISKLLNLPIGPINLVLNIGILFLGSVFISKDFAKRSILSAATVSLMIIFLESYFPDVNLTNDLILNVIFGPLIIAFGLGLIFYNGGSSGGTDVIATIINKYSNIPIHIGLFFTDLTVIILAMFILGFEPSLYSVLAIIVQAICLDYVSQGLGRKIAVFVISDKHEEINDLMINKYHRGVTLLHAQGGYTGREKKLVLTISNVRRFPVIKEEILKLDDKAFIFSYTISEVYGSGFTKNQLG
ncbi:YitT family protein [Anaerococcus sp. mt242]|uniref:YitT family protein n=1 Tax=Anaerococcus sp. mt242 TaxID=2661917 RepID=UPI001931EC1B|nr:YitT family protein [Anaerococcus sp. mt242]MBM0045709.1 YitT family protein [Anaerococcus sp. mt242]